MDFESGSKEVASILSARELSHSFDYPLFSDISLDIAKKESVAVVGVSGSGKSTLLHILSSFLKPQKGRVELFGEDIYSLDYSRVLKIRRELIGIVFQSHYLFKGFTAKENIEVAALLAKTETDMDLIRSFSIERLLNKKIGDLSGGEQQRVSVARVLTKKPKMIFADEPTGNLDSKTAEEVMEQVFEYIDRNGAGLFLVTHDMRLASRCDRLYRLEGGALVQ